MTSDRLPRAIWLLGFVSLLMDVSSEMIHSLLPLFLVGSLHVSVSTVGVIEGVAEASALVAKVFSGVLSDRAGRRKHLALLGYGLSALTKPLFALAHGAGVVVAARFVDRVGKGVRGAPRDALVADLTPSTTRGAAYGLRQALDTVGACVGPLLATVLMLVLANDYRAVFWVAVVPALLSVALLAFGVHEPARVTGSTQADALRASGLRQLDRAYWGVVAIGAVFTLARFSEAFLVLKGQQAGLSPPMVPIVMVVMSLVYGISAYPFGRLADRAGAHGRRARRLALLACGLLALIAADVALAAAGRGALLWLGVALWGLHMGMTQGLLSAMVADTAPQELRGTAFGVFNLVSGGAMLAASALAGALWDRHGPATTFTAGAAFAAATLLVIGWQLRSHRPPARV